MHAWSLTYYNAKVAQNINAWPDGLLARFSRLAGMMQEFGPNLGMPHTRAMGDGLFEVRAKAREGIGRVFYCTVVGQRIVILHAFVKKTERTPQREWKVARERMKKVRSA